MRKRGLWYHEEAGDIDLGFFADAVEQMTAELDDCKESAPASVCRALEDVIIKIVQIEAMCKEIYPHVQELSEVFRQLDLRDEGNGSVQAVQRAAVEWAKNRSDPKEPCKHVKCIPKFDPLDAKCCNSIEEIRRRWPRFFGVCPDCDESVILYASKAHMVYGDW